MHKIHTKKYVKELQRLECLLPFLPRHIEMSSQITSKNELHVSSDELSQIVSTIVNEYLYLTKDRGKSKQFYLN